MIILDYKVLAMVNGREITDKDIDKLIMKYPYNERKKLEDEKEKKKLLDKLISCEVMYAYAKEEKLEETKEYKDLLDEAAKDILTQMAIKKAMGLVEITEVDALKYYEDNRDKFYVSDMVSLKQILVETKEDALKIREEIIEEVISFSEAALKYSICPSAVNGGSIGTFGRGKLISNIEEVAFSSKKGELLGPVETEYGFHLFIKEDHSEGYMKDFEDVKDSIINELTRKGQLNNYKAIVDEMNKKYKVQRYI